MDELNIDNQVIHDILKDIVSKQHSHPDKKMVNPKDGGGFQIACPYCGDSHKNPRNYRGNFNSLLYYKCFNDGCGKKTHFTEFCKDFDFPIDIGIKQKLYTYLDSQTNSFDTYQDELINNGIKHLIDINDLSNHINSKQNKSPLLDFKPIQNKSKQYNYLIYDRGLTEDLFNDIYQATFHRGNDWFEPVVVYLNKMDNKVIGMQTRNLKDSYKRKFHIFTYEDLYNWMGRENLSDGQIMMYNKISYFYGILGIDFNKKVTIFEGRGDSILYNNAIGVVGVNTDLRFLIDNNIDLQFFYDNDKAGWHKSEEMIRRGFPCFLWNMFFEHLLEKKKSNTPYEYLNKIKKVKDLGKLNKLAPKLVKSTNFNAFYSKDTLDLKYIPKIKKNYAKHKHI